MGYDDTDHYFSLLERLGEAGQYEELYKLKQSTEEALDKYGLSISDIYDIEAPNQTVAEEIWRVVWLAGFTVGMSKPWQGRMDVPTHFMLKSFAWEKEKLHRMVQLIGWHFPNVRIKMILPLKENLKGYSWYRNRLDISQKILIYSRSAMLSLLSKDNFTDPWPEFRRLAKLD